MNFIPVSGGQNYNEGKAITPRVSCQGYEAPTLCPGSKNNDHSVPGEENDGEYDSPWFAFNDFMVQNVSEEEALSFPGKWKVCRLARLV